MTWWRRGVIYEIYPRSFQDSDGDGVGDLRGVAARLPYLRELGVDAIWLTPIYPSPQRDFGYDITDHCDVDPQYGIAGRLRRAGAPGARAGPARDPRLRPEPHLRPAPVVPRAPRALPVARRPAAQQLDRRVRRAGLGAGGRSQLLPRLPARAARPRLAQPRGPRGDVRRAALLAGPRRRRLPRRRPAPAAQGPEAARQPARPGLRSRPPRPRVRLADPEVYDRPRRAAGDRRRDARRDRRPAVHRRGLRLDRAADAVLRRRRPDAVQLPPAGHAVGGGGDRRPGRALRGRAARRAHGRTGCSATTTGRGSPAASAPPRRAWRRCCCSPCVARRRSTTATSSG